MNMLLQCQSVGIGGFLICIMLNVALVCSIAFASVTSRGCNCSCAFSSWVMATVMSADLIELMSNFAKGESRNEGFRDRALKVLEKLEITEIAHVQGSFENFAGQLAKLEVRSCLWHN